MKVAAWESVSEKRETRGEVSRLPASNDKAGAGGLAPSARRVAEVGGVDDLVNRLERMGGESGP